MENIPYYLNYYRQQGIVDAVSWLCGKCLPAVLTKNPYLYIQTAKGNDGSMAVGLFNMNYDEIIDPVITLDKCYSEIEFLNCEGSLKGDKVILSGDIQPYSAVFFEVN